MEATVILSVQKPRVFCEFLAAYLMQRNRLATAVNNLLPARSSQARGEDGDQAEGGIADENPPREASVFPNAGIEFRGRLRLW